MPAKFANLKETPKLTLRVVRLCAPTAVSGLLTQTCDSRIAFCESQHR